MKARIIILMLTFGLLVGGNQASAQIGSFLKDKAKNALNKGTKKGNEDEKKKENEQTQQQQTQQQENQQQEQQQTHQTNQNPAGNFMQRKMMGMMGMNNVKYETKYGFSSSMTMEMQATDSTGKKSDKVLYTTYFDKNSKSFAMEFEGKDKETGKKQKSLMIFDYTNWAMLILGEKDGGQMSGIAMQMQKDSAIEAQQKNPQQTEQPKKDLTNYNMYYKATGRTKTIAGYSCKEYVYENMEGRAEIWATNDIIFDYSSAYGQMGVQTLATGGNYGMGTALEWHFINKNTSRSDMTVVDIKPSNPKSLDISGYQIIGMGGQQPSKEQGKNKKDKKK